jgi:hypothetical protein
MLNNKCSIRYFVDEGWYMFTVRTDSEWDWIGLSKVANIEYCPFCGEKLK